MESGNRSQLVLPRHGPTALCLAQVLPLSLGLPICEMGGPGVMCSLEPAGQWVTSSGLSFRFLYLGGSNGAPPPV